jgi:hypothetical protein
MAHKMGLNFEHMHGEGSVYTHWNSFDPLSFRITVFFVSSDLLSKKYAQSSFLFMVLDHREVLHNSVLTAVRNKVCGSPRK